MISLACGSCGDVEVARLLPFVFYLTLLFLFWALGWGLLGSVLSRRAGVRLRVKPLRHLAAAVIVIVAAGPFTLGSLLMPMVLFLPVWFLRLWRCRVLEDPPVSKAARRFEALAERVRRMTLALCMLLVPLAFVRQYVQRNPDVLPFREWLVVPEPVAAVGAVVFAWAVVVGVWQARGKARDQASGKLAVSPARAR